MGGSFFSMLWQNRHGEVLSSWKLVPAIQVWASWLFIRNAVFASMQSILTFSGEIIGNRFLKTALNAVTWSGFGIPSVSKGYSTPTKKEELCSSFFVVKRGNKSDFSVC